MGTFDRYAQFRAGNEIKLVTFGEVPEKASDKYITYEIISFPELSFIVIVLLANTDELNIKFIVDC